MSATKDGFIFPSRQGAMQGAHIPPWLLALGLPAEQIVLWAVIGRCADGRKATRGFSIPRLAGLVGWSCSRVRVTLHRLEAAGLIHREQQPGRRPTFRFPAHPQCRTENGRHLTWKELVAQAEAPVESDNQS